MNAIGLGLRVYSYSSKSDIACLGMETTFGIAGLERYQVIGTEVTTLRNEVCDCVVVKSNTVCRADPF